MWRSSMNCRVETAGGRRRRHGAAGWRVLWSERRNLESNGQSLQYLGRGAVGLALARNDVKQ